MMRHLRKTALATGLLPLSLIAFNPAMAGDETKEAWRLFVSDQEAAAVTVIDPADGSILDQFSTTGYVSHLVPSESGETVVAVQMDHDTVHVIKSGISMEGHGDHQDISVDAAALLPVKLEGKRPVHAVMHHDEILIFYDGEGEARVFSENALIEGTDDFFPVKAAAPHHGVTVPMGDYYLMSAPDLSVDVEEGKLPPRFGLDVLDTKGQKMGDSAVCTGLHGEAHSAGIVAFGCKEGVIVASPNGSNPPKVTMLAYGDDMPAGRVGTLRGGKAMQFFLGNYGADKLVLIDPSSEAPYKLVNLPVRHVHFVLDPARVDAGYVFTEDGYLHVLDVLKGEIVRSGKITAPYSKDGHWRDPRPRLAVMDDLIAVTDPREELVRLVDAESLEEVRTISVKGLPFNIAAVGGSGLEH